MNDREKIRQEIERLIQISNDIGFVVGECGYRTGLREVIQYIDSLPPETQPVPSSFQFLENEIEDMYKDDDGEPADDHR